MDMRPARQHQGLILKISITWLCSLLLLGFLIATRSTASPITMSVIPEVPKTDAPIVATFNINNPSDEAARTDYQFYVNGKLVESGSVSVAPYASAKYQYAMQNTLERGEQVNFVLKTRSANGDIDKTVSLPAYPPQLMSSFVSFAAFSTSVMSSMVTIEYFNSTFGATSDSLNTGIIVAIVLTGLLIFLELTQAVAPSNKTITLGKYRTSFATMRTILFIIFIGMVFTKIVMLVAV